MEAAFRCLSSAFLTIPMHLITSMYPRNTNQCRIHTFSLLSVSSSTCSVLIGKQLNKEHELPYKLGIVLGEGPLFEPMVGNVLDKNIIEPAFSKYHFFFPVFLTLRFALFIDCVAALIQILRVDGIVAAKRRVSTM